MIARSFPPFRSVGGSIRIVKFIKYLPSLGWNPVVLTIDDHFEYETWRKLGSESLLVDIPEQTKIYRIPAAEKTLDAVEREKQWYDRHRIPGIVTKVFNSARRWILRSLLLPDRYIRWLPVALKHGLQVMKEEEIDIIFTTSPSFSVSIVGAVLKRLTGKPLVVDFRDDWIDTPGFNEKPAISRWIERKLEQFVIKTADRVTLVTEWSMKAFVNRHSSEVKDKFVFISNGCDLEDFEAPDNPPESRNHPQFTIVHAGLLNDSDSWSRRPTTVFHALLGVIQERPGAGAEMKLMFTGRLTNGLRQMVSDMGLSDLVEELGHLPREGYVRLLRGADLLLAINYENFETLIPGKLYEYWAAGKAPILLLSCKGAAQSLVEKYDLGYSVLPDDVKAIQDAILDVYDAHKQGASRRINSERVVEYSRKTLSSKLAQIFSEVHAGKALNSHPMKPSILRNS